MRGICSARVVPTVQSVRWRAGRLTPLPYAAMFELLGGVDRGQAPHRDPRHAKCDAAALCTGFPGEGTGRGGERASRQVLRILQSAISSLTPIRACTK